MVKKGGSCSKPGVTASLITIFGRKIIQENICSRGDEVVYRLDAGFAADLSS